MNTYNIGSKVSVVFETAAYVGKVTDVFELGHNDNVYEVVTEVGTFNLDNNGNVIV